MWTVLHNFDCRAPDGTTPAARFFRRAFPDLFETVLSHIEDLPLPRQRKHEVRYITDIIQVSRFTWIPATTNHWAISYAFLTLGVIFLDRRGLLLMVR